MQEEQVCGAHILEGQGQGAAMGSVLVEALITDDIIVGSESERMRSYYHRKLDNVIILSSASGSTPS